MNPFAAAAAVVFLSTFSSLAQGSLTPPGPPGATMLTLSQVEPRMPVDATHTPGNSQGEFVISNSGSYYLTTNIAGVSGKDGIDVNANNVTLDLNGFSVIGVSGSLTGVNISSANVLIHNGIISSWGRDGISSSGMSVTMQGLTVCSNYVYGIYLNSPYSVVSGNNVVGNNTSATTGDAGIFVGGSDCLIQNNHVVATIGGTSAIGIFVEGAGNIAIQNFVEGNGANDMEWGSLAIVGQFINTTSGQIVTNSNPWGNFEF